MRPARARARAQPPERNTRMVHAAPSAPSPHVPTSADKHCAPRIAPTKKVLRTTGDRRRFRAAAAARPMSTAQCSRYPGIVFFRKLRSWSCTVARKRYSRHDSRIIGISHYPSPGARHGERAAAGVETKPH